MKFQRQTFFSSQSVKAGPSPSKKISLYLLQCKPFKNDEKCFLFHLKSSFCSQDNYIFVLTFWSCSRNGLIRKIRLISKFLTLQPGWQTITIYILSNISRSKGNQILKLSQVIEYKNRNIFLQKIMEKMRQGE